MAEQIVECVPNFSEGRRKNVVNAIVRAIRSVEGVTLLDQSSDADHNRSVVTFVGVSNAVEEAAYRGIQTASELIDMTKHRGEHPRMGAADVVPFVPISGVSLQECIGIARRLGERVGRDLRIPVYLYEGAASREERRNLENVRKGEYEGIREIITTDLTRKPDFGPSRMGPAGAVAIGARQPLIAYNVYLNTEDVGIAQKIARAIRHSSGGLRFVKAAGFLVDNKAQVSMNLTDYRKTPVARVLETIRREARRFGKRIEKSELIGLIPQEALNDAAAWYLQFHDFDRQQILEQRMQSAGKQDAIQTSEVSFLEALASADPTPGGGSAAAQAGAMAAALVAMVARLTVGKKKYADVQAEMETLAAAADSLRAEFTAAVKADAAAFDQVISAIKLSKGTAKQESARKKAIEKATLEAARQPLHVAGLAVSALELALNAARLGNSSAVSDAGTAGALAFAALEGAGLNVRINVHALGTNKRGTEMLKELRALQRKAERLQTKIREQVSARGGFKL